MEELGKKLSKLLKHTASSEGLDVSAAGWIPIYQILERLDIRISDLRKLVEKDTSGRIELRKSMIRTSHGHSAAMPVVYESLEASWKPYVGSDVLWYGTNLNYLGIIAGLGIKPAKKTHIQLTEEKNNAFWRRSKISVLLEVSPKKLRQKKIDMFQASDGIVLVRHIPESCFVRACLRGEKNLVPSAQKFIPPKWKSLV